MEHQQALAAYSAQPSREAWDLACELLEQAREILLGRRTPPVQEQKQDQRAGLRAAWAQRFGNPDDPEVQARGTLLARRMLAQARPA